MPHTEAHKAAISAKLRGVFNKRESLKKKGLCQCSACYAWIPSSEIQIQGRPTGKKGKIQLWGMCKACYEFLNRPITKGVEP